MSATRRITSSPLQGGAHNDVQVLTLANNSGTDTFTLTYLSGEADEEVTAALNDDATAQSPDGQAFVRASYAGTPFTSEAPLVTLIAFG